MRERQPRHLLSERRQRGSDLDEPVAYLAKQWEDPTAGLPRQLQSDHGGVSGCSNHISAGINESDRHQRFVACLKLTIGVRRIDPDRGQVTGAVAGW
jgi:hypothetical protein